MSEGKTNLRTRYRNLRTRYGAQALVLVVLWLVLSGHYDAFHLSLGALSVAIVLFIHRKMDAIRTRECAARESMRIGPALAYGPWLLKEMILSAWHVASVVITPGLQLDPGIVRFKCRLPNDLARVILGNSITLTPGTLTVDLQGDEFTIHYLSTTSKEGLLGGEMQRRVARLFGEELEDLVYDIVEEERPRLRP